MSYTEFATTVNIDDQTVFPDNLNVQELAKECLNWANTGNPLAMNNIGFLLCRSKQIPSDYVTGIYWLKRSADMQNPISMYNIADMYYDGIGLAKNNEMAISWFSKAVDFNHSRAMMRMAWIYETKLPQDFAKAFELYSKCAQNNNSFAMIKVGDYYFEGEDVPMDLDLACEFYIRAAITENNPNSERMANIIAKLKKLYNSELYSSDKVTNQLMMLQNQGKYPIIGHVLNSIIPVAMLQILVERDRLQKENMQKDALIASLQGMAVNDDVEELVHKKRRVSPPVEERQQPILFNNILGLNNMNMNTNTFASYPQQTHC
jgi:TPR repeat protein